MIGTMEYKICIKCNTGKNVSEFHNNRSRPDGKATYCKPCNRSMCKPKTTEQVKRHSASYHKKHPEKNANNFGRHGTKKIKIPF